MPISKSNRYGGIILSLFLIFILHWISLSVLTAQNQPENVNYHLGQTINPENIKLDLKQFGETDLICDFEGNLFLLSSAKNRIFKISPKGESKAEIGGFGFGTRQFNRPLALATPDQGLNLFVLDSENRRVVRLNNSLNWIEQIDTPDFAGDKKIGELHGLTVNSLFDLYISDPVNMRIIRLSRNGKFIEETGGLNALFRGSRLCMDEKNYLYALSDDCRNVIAFDDLNNITGKYSIPVTDTAFDISVDSRYLYLSCKDHISILHKGKELREFSRIILPRNGMETPACAVAAASDGNGRLWIVDISHNRIYGYDPAGR